MRQSKFTIDTFGGLELTGFTDDEDWNGWACPYFAFDEASKIVEAHKAIGHNAWYDESSDQFVFETVDEPEFYPAIINDGKKLYPVGNCSWIWEEAERLMIQLN